jgi:hypothetical protein
LTQFWSAEKDFVAAPPVQSVEAERLLRTAQEQFGIGNMVRATKESVDFLERRYQWSKTQLLAVTGVLIFILDKVLPIKYIWPSIAHADTLGDFFIRFWQQLVHVK